MWKYLLLTAGICFGTVITGFSQDTTSGSVLKWDLQTCLDYAKKNNITIRTLRGDEQISEQNLLQSKAARYPNLSASLSQTLVNSNNANPVVGGFQTQATASGNYAL